MTGARLVRVAAAISLPLAVACGLEEEGQAAPDAGTGASGGQAGTLGGSAGSQSAGGSGGAGGSAGSGGGGTGGVAGAGGVGGAAGAGGAGGAGGSGGVSGAGGAGGVAGSGGVGAAGGAGGAGGVGGVGAAGGAGGVGGGGSGGAGGSGGGTIPSCSALYAQVTGVNQVCNAPPPPAGQCRLAVDTDSGDGDPGQTCAGICADAGGECLGTFDQGATNCMADTNQSIGCQNSDQSNAVCFCSQGCGNGPPCPSGSACQQGQCVP